MSQAGHVYRSGYLYGQGYDKRQTDRQTVVVVVGILGPGVGGDKRVRNGSGGVGGVAGKK